MTQTTVPLRSISPYVFVAILIIAFFRLSVSLPHFNTKTNNNNTHSAKFNFCLMKYLALHLISFRLVFSSFLYVTTQCMQYNNFCEFGFLFSFADSQNADRGKKHKRSLTPITRFRWIYSIDYQCRPIFLDDLICHAPLHARHPFDGRTACQLYHTK